jgi:hypothetical protein
LAVVALHAEGQLLRAKNLSQSRARLWLMGNDVLFRVAVFGAGTVSVWLAVYLLF